MIPDLLSAWRITHLVSEKHSAAYAAARDAVLKARVPAGVQVDVLGYTLAVVDAHGGKATAVQFLVALGTSHMFK